MFITGSRRRVNGDGRGSGTFEELGRPTTHATKSGVAQFTSAD